jgi:hypothetical protein
MTQKAVHVRDEQSSEGENTLFSLNLTRAALVRQPPVQRTVLRRICQPLQLELDKHCALVTQMVLGQPRSLANHPDLLD